MVLTPEFRPQRSQGSLSPLILAQPGPSHSQKPPVRRSSTGSYSHLSDFQLDGGSVTSDPVEDSEQNSTPGVRHIDLALDPAEWRRPVFKQKILATLQKLKVPSWTSAQLRPTSIHLQKVSGALTNAVFFVTFNPAPNPTSPTMSPLLTPTMPPSDPNHPPPFAPKEYPVTLILRVYGPSSDALISRTEELRILHVLCTEYGLGPRLYGTFANGRVEQFFPSRALTALELRDPAISRGIASRMRELHSVDLRLLGYIDGREGEPMVWRCLREWILLAETVLELLLKAESHQDWMTWAQDFKLSQVREEMEEYRNWVDADEGKGKGVVFAHNDTQYGNILKLEAPLARGKPDHHRYIVIDFEYAAPNPRGYDVANHFHEWRANYHHPTHSHSLQPHFPYPSIEQREEFYRAYLSIEVDSSGGETVGRRTDVARDRIARLEREVRIWSPACSIFWALWGIVQAEEQIKGVLAGTQDKFDFDYLSYAKERIDMFRQEAVELGALKTDKMDQK